MELPAELRSEIRRIELKTRRVIDADLMGRYRSAFRGTGLSFAELREYQPGDDVKHIHWKATARSNKVFVKSFEEERQLTIMLLVDVSRSTIFGSEKSKHARALEFSALIAALAQQNNDQVGLCLFSDDIETYIPPAKTGSQGMRVIRDLLEPRNLRGSTNLAQALRITRERQRRRAIVFVISDFFCANYEQELKLLAYRHDVVCVRLCDPLDQQFPKAGIVEFIDAETGERMALDTSSAQSSVILKTLSLKQRDELNQLCKKNNVDLIDIEGNPVRALATLMAKRAKRIR